MNFLLSAVIGYLLGSIPTAYIIIKKAKGLDITKEGSGNVGAMNSYEVSNSKSIGIYVFIVDFFKGLISVLIVYYLISPEFSYCAISLIYALLSHCFNPWIGFKGGRGLATAAGGIIFLFFPLLIAWIMFWLIVYILKKDILLANIFATILCAVSSLFINESFTKFAYPNPLVGSELILFISAGLMIIFIKHIEPLKEILLKK